MKFFQAIFSTFIRYIYLALFLIIIWAMVFIGMTQPGLEFVIGLIKPSLPGNLQIQHIKGTLYSGFTLENLSYEDSAQQITVKTFQFAWIPSQLLHRKLVISNFLLDHTNIILKTPPTTQSKDDSDFNFISWLKYLEVRRAILQNLTINGTINGLAIHGMANILFLNDILNITNTKINIGDSELNLAGTVKDSWNVGWSFKANSPYSVMSNGIITGPRFTPQIQSHIAGQNLSFNNGDQLIKKMNGDILIDLKPETQSRLAFTFENIIISDYKINQINLTSNGQLTKDQLTAQLRLFVNNSKNQITGTFTLPRPLQTGLSQPVKGILNLQFNDLINFFARNKYIKRPRGTLLGQLQISGTLEKPLFNGNTQLTHGYIKVKKTDTKFKDINLRLLFNNDQINMNGSCLVGDNPAVLQGTFDIKKLALNLNLAGKNLRLANSSEYKLSASPNLSLTANTQEINLQGQIYVSSASLTPKNFADTISLPSDVIFVGQSQKKSVWPSNLVMHVKLKLSDDIYISYQDLSSRLSGSLIITQNPGSPILATGQLYTIKGTYKAYGQALTIREGRLVYTGNALLNPGLDIQAVKIIKSIGRASNSSMLDSEDITAGVRVTGTVNQPVFTLFSIPGGFSQADILSYIIFGYPQSQISGTSSLALLKAASSLNSGTGNLNALTGKLQKALGSAGITTESTEIYDPHTNSVVSKTTVGVNKQLGPKLSLHYNIGLFYPVSILNLRYQFSKHWAIQSESSAIDNGADVLYGFEKD